MELDFWDKKGDHLGLFQTSCYCRHTKQVCMSAPGGPHPVTQQSFVPVPLVCSTSDLIHYHHMSDCGLFEVTF